MGKPTKKSSNIQEAKSSTQMIGSSNGNTQPKTKLDRNFESNEIFKEVSLLIDRIDSITLFSYFDEDLTYYQQLQEHFYKEFELAPNKQAYLNRAIERIKDKRFNFDIPELRLNVNYGKWFELAHFTLNYLLKGQNPLIRKFEPKYRLHFLNSVVRSYPIKNTLKDFPELTEIAVSTYPAGVYWLEALFYIRRAGNFAHFLTFLTTTLQNYNQGTFIMPSKDLTAEVGQLNQRLLLLDRLEILKAISDHVGWPINSNKFTRLIAHIFAVKPSAIEKQLRIASYEPGKEKTNKNNHRKLTHYAWLIEIAKKDLALPQETLDRLAKEMEQV